MSHKVWKLGADIDGDGLLKVAASAGWWWPLKDVAILSERPNLLARDGQGRLHSETGPALRYPDGWAIHALHGVVVPADLIEDGWSVERIMREQNVEVRRAAIELTGWDRFVDQAGCNLISTSEDPGNPGHYLRLFALPPGLFEDPVNLLLCDNATPERDGTRKRYGLTVPHSITDPAAAAAWTFDVTPTEYRALARAT